MAFDLTGTKAEADATLKEFGIPVKVTRNGASVGSGYGIFTANTTSLDSAQGVQTGLGSRTMKLGAIAKAPEIGDTVVADKTSFSVRSVAALRPTTVTLLYTLELAGG